MLHVIPDDGQPHAASTECGCGPQLARAVNPTGGGFAVFYHLFGPAWDPDATTRHGSTSVDQSDQQP